MRAHGLSAGFSPHGLRSGFVTQARLNGAANHQIRVVSRHGRQLLAALAAARLSTFTMADLDRLLPE
jgi:hypothetical protein